MILTRKIQLYIVTNNENEEEQEKEKNRVYKYLRDGMFNQNKAMNQYMSALYVAIVQDISKDDRKELNNLYSRISTSKKGSAYEKDVEFAKGLPTGAWTQAVQQDFNKSCKDGLLTGKVSLPTYKKDNPLLVHVDYVRLRSTNPHRDNGIYHNYSSHEEFLSHLYSNDLEVFIKFANNITFKMVFGSPYKSHALRKEIQQIFEEKYNVRGSSIQIDKNKKIILNLSMDIPEQKKELNEDTVVGVDLGIAVPAMCALNNDMYKRYAIGNVNDFVRVRTKLQAQRKRLSKSLKYASGGHGRKKKLKALERLSKSEANFVETYCHMVSKRVVDFALSNNAKYINIENLKGYDTSDFVLRNWSYYKLQQYIKYKAERFGIVVRKVNPCYTSQVCSVCGNWEPDQRKSQAVFECANNDCDSYKKYDYGFNADFNAARNIAMSTLFKEEGEIKDEDKKAAREYYGITEKYEQYEKEKENKKSDKKNKVD